MSQRIVRSACDLLIEHSLTLLKPLVRLLLVHGVTYPRFAAALKRVFYDVAIEELSSKGSKNTDSAISLLTGLQRRDTRLLGSKDAKELPAKSQRPSVAQQVVLRWASLPGYLDPDDQPRRLLINSNADDVATFTTLAQSVSKDVHAASVLEDLIRLGLVRLTEDGYVERVAESGVPENFEELLKLIVGSTGDHLAAAVANVLGEKSKFLEYSLFSDELRPESVEELHALARTQSQQLFKKARNAAIDKTDRDRMKGFVDVPEMRMRMGVYFYAEPLQRIPVMPNDEPNSDGENTEN
jgi:Family of unknown function (DUF6502)